MPSSPPPLRAPNTAPPVLAPTPVVAAGTTSRPPPPTHSRRHPTSAEAYATAHSRRDRDKSHKPIFQWISRKLGGGTRRATLSDITQTQTPTPPQASLTPIQIFPPSRDSISRSESHSLRSYSMSYATSTRRQANNPYPSLPVPPRRTSMADSYSLAPSMSLYMDRSPASSQPSLSGSYAMTYGGADENASVRAIPPSNPTSPTSSAVLSHSNSTSLLPPLLRERDSMHSSESSDNDRRRDSGSTKPTTIISFDSGPHIAHIAQAPIAPLRTSNLSPTTPSPITPNMNRAPRHSLPHPRDNPHPSSPPLPNASTLTLASSTFALPHPPPSIRLSTPIPRAGSLGLATSPSVTFAPDRDRERERERERGGSVHVDGGNSSHALSIRGGGRGVDRDASVRAVRRKGSWESYESGWSWRAGGAGVVHHRFSGVGMEDEVEREGMHMKEGVWPVKPRSEEDDVRVGEAPMLEGARFSLEASIPITA